MDMEKDNCGQHLLFLVDATLTRANEAWTVGLNGARRRSDASRWAAEGNREKRYPRMGGIARTRRHLIDGALRPTHRGCQVGVVGRWTGLAARA